MTSEIRDHLFAGLLNDLDCGHGGAAMKTGLYVFAAIDLFLCVVAAYFCVIAFREGLFYLSAMDAVMCLIWTHKFIDTAGVISRS